jgi:beta-galactosidase
MTRTIDLTGKGPGIKSALPLLGGSSPKGDSIGFTSAYITFNGEPWLAVCGEMHYCRYPRRYWRDELQKMKACGVDVVSTYIFWNHHEEEEGVFDWSGDRDLRSFVELCGQIGLYVIVRVGPFGHGEARNGGLPDWLYGRPFPVRSNHPRYLDLTRRLYMEIGRQLAGLFFKDSGPIIGVQLENEFMHAAAPWETTPRLCLEYVTTGTGGIEHMRILKRLALEAGLLAPIYACTGWGGAPILEGEILPLYGGYAFCPWNVTESTPIHAPTREFLFRDFHGSDRRYDNFDPPYDPASMPFACCEIGGGMQSWYRYRAVAAPQCVEAMALVKLAGGCSMLGYYMFHGGSQTAGRHGFLNEHVVPRVSYDFQAPLGEFGQVRESYRRLRRLHLFLHEFGKRLAPMRTVLPDCAGDLDPRDVDTLRFAVRASGDSGFLFFNNFQDHLETKDHPHVAVDVGLASGSLRVPSTGGFTLKSGACAVMPFNLEVGGARMRYSTAQPMALLEADGTTHCFSFEHEGIPAEYCFEMSGITSVEREGCGRREERGLIFLQPRVSGRSAFAITVKTGARVVFHTLTEIQSLGFSRLRIWERERAIITDADVYESEGALRLILRGSSARRVELLVLPAAEMPLAAMGARLQSAPDGDFTRYSIGLPARTIDLGVTKPNDADTEVRLAAGAFDGVKEIFLSIEYEGDVGSAFIDGRLVADDFSNGEPWEIGLERFRPAIEEKGISVHVTPRREGTVVFRESAMALQRELIGREVAEIRSITAIVEREVVVAVEDAARGAPS